MEREVIFKMQGKGIEKVWLGGSAIINWIVSAGLPQKIIFK